MNLKLNLANDWHASQSFTLLWLRRRRRIPLHCLKKNVSTLKDLVVGNYTDKLQCWEQPWSLEADHISHSFFALETKSALWSSSNVSFLCKRCSSFASKAGILHFLFPCGKHLGQSGGWLLKFMIKIPSLLKWIFSLGLLFVYVPSRGFMPSV